MSTWEQRLKARSAAARLAATQELARQATVDDLPWLLLALEDRSNLVSAAAARGLAGLRVASAIKPLIDRYWWLAENGVTRDSGCLARVAIVQALSACRALEAAEVLLHAIKTVQVERSGDGLEDMGMPLREQAALALGQLRPRGALLALALLLFDTQPAVPAARPGYNLFVTQRARCTAATALAELGDAGAVAVLGVKLAHPEAEVADVLVACMDALATLDEETSLQLLPAYLDNPDAFLAAGAATALTSLSAEHHDRVLQLLTEACYKARGERATALAMAIGAVRSEAAVEVLHKLAIEAGSDAGLGAVAALAQRGDPPAKDALRSIAEQTGAKIVREEAARQLRD